MGDIIDIETPGGKALKERMRVVEPLRTLASKVKTLQKSQLMHALPIAVSGVADLEQRLAPLLH